MADLRLPADLAWVMLATRVVGTDHSLRRVKLKHYTTRITGAAQVPVFVAEEDTLTEAVDFRDLTPVEVARIAFLLTVLTGAELPDPLVGTGPVLPHATDPLPKDWTQNAGRILAEAMPELLAWQDRLPPDRVARMVPMMRTRAWSRLLARSEPARDTGAPPVDTPPLIDHHRRAYANFFATDEFDISYPLFDGAVSPIVTRGVFVSADAALVLPYDPHRDRVLLVEQFRIGAFARGSANPWVLEGVAGLVDPGETPEETAHREAREEAGLTLTTLERIGSGHPSPGATTEFYHLFVGLADLPDDSAGLGGLASEAEDIRSHILPFAAFLDRLDRGDFAAVPLALMGHWLARHRDRLRADAGAA